MVIKPKRNRNQVAEVKLQMLQIISKDPNISYNELSRRLGINNHTAKKYRDQLDAMQGRIKTEITQSIEQKVEEKAGILQTLSRAVSKYFNLNEKAG